MSKELTPLEALDRLRCFKTLNKDYEFEIIETALKDYEEMKKPKKIVGSISFEQSMENYVKNNCPSVSNKLKALEILKKCNDKAPDNNKIFRFSSYDRPSDLGPTLHVDYLIIGNACFPITEEEKKALKEALGIR